MGRAPEVDVGGVTLAARGGQVAKAREHGFVGVPEKGLCVRAALYDLSIGRKDEQDSVPLNRRRRMDGLTVTII